MFLKKILPISVILLAGLLAFYNYEETCIGSVNSTNQNGWQGVYEIKAERKAETCGWVAGAYYTFSSRSADSEEWREIMTFRHDDPIDIPSESIRIINNKVAIVFMGWKAAVTSDGGRTWNLWDAEKDLSTMEGVSYGLIENMSISENGNATMILNPISDKKQPKELYTKDFGKNWTQTK